MHEKSYSFPCADITWQQCFCKWSRNLQLYNVLGSKGAGIQISVCLRPIMIVFKLAKGKQVSMYRKEYVNDSQFLCVFAHLCECFCAYMPVCWPGVCTLSECLCCLCWTAELWRAVPIQVPAALPHEHSHRTQAVHVPMVRQRLQHETVFWWAHENTHRWEMAAWLS